MLRLTPVVKYLLIINVLLFIASQTMNLDALALYYPDSDYFRPFQIITHFFMHGGVAHLFFNMFALVMFGSVLESLWGAKRFLFFYIFCALGAAALHVMVNFYEVNAFNKAVAIYQTNPSHQEYFNFFDKYENAKRLLTAQGEEQFKQIAIDLKNKTPNSKEISAGFIREIGEAYVPYITPRIVGASGAIFWTFASLRNVISQYGTHADIFTHSYKSKIFYPNPDGNRAISRSQPIFLG